MPAASRRHVLGCVLIVACAGADAGVRAEPEEGPPRFDAVSGAGGAPSSASGDFGGSALDPASAAPGGSGGGASSEGPPAVQNGIEPSSSESGDSALGGAGSAEGGAAGSGAMPPLPQRSPGCGNVDPPRGQLSIRVGGADAPYTVTLPPGYDPSVPEPLVFGFHGRGRTHLEFQQVDASNIQTEVGGRAIMAYLKSQAGNGWNFAEEVEPNVAFFEAVYAQMLQSYCVDVDRVFAIGHSSGGYFSNILGCRFADRIRGVASIAGASQENNCPGRVAALVIHGVRDSVVSFDSGRASRDAYLARNACSGVTQAAPVQPCLAYDGCAAGFPVQWCEHQEPTYENTNHGWPSFASRAVGDFLFSLP